MFIPFEFKALIFLNLSEHSFVLEKKYFEKNKMFEFYTLILTLEKYAHIIHFEYNNF